MLEIAPLYRKNEMLLFFSPAHQTNILMEEGDLQPDDAAAVGVGVALSEAGKDALAANVHQLFQKLPKQSWLRNGLAHRLLGGDMSLDDAEAVSGLSRNFISKAPGVESKKRERQGYQDPFEESAPTSKFRKVRVTETAAAQHASATAFLRARYSMCRSGDKKEVFRTHMSRWASFQQFREGGGAAGVTAFQAAWSDLGVTVAKHAPHDYFSCIKCQSFAKDLAALEAQIAQLEVDLSGVIADAALRKEKDLCLLEAQAEAATLRVCLCVFFVVTCSVWQQAHRVRFEHQRDAYQRQREDISAGVLFITGDFGAIPVQDSAAGSGQLPDLVLVLHFRDEKGELVHCYLDCIPMLDQHESKDWNYVSSTFDELLEAGFFAPFYKIIWWSDTGPNHFRTSNTIHYWRKFQERSEIVVEVNFLAPYHGHSMCDGHLGAISRTITHNGNMLNGDLARWNRAWVEGLMAQLSFTTIVNVPIVRTEKLVQTVKGITQFLGFSFNVAHPDSACCYRMSGDPNPKLVQFVQLLPSDAIIQENLVDAL